MLEHRNLASQLLVLARVQARSNFQERGLTIRILELKLRFCVIMNVAGSGMPWGIMFFRLIVRNGVADDETFCITMQSNRRMSLAVTSS